MYDFRDVLRASLSVALLIAALPLAAQQYTVTPLPSPPGETTVPIGTAINASGTVTGFLGVSPPAGVFGEPGVVWQLEAPGQPTATALFQYSPGGTTQDLGSYDPEVNGSSYCANTVSPSIGLGINGSGQITGAVCATTESAQAFSFANGAFTLPAALAPGPSVLSSWGNGINTSGTIVGTMLAGTWPTGSPCAGGNDYHTFIYDTATANLQDLGTLLGCDAFGLAINDSGQIAGAMFDTSLLMRAYLFSNGSMTDLGNLGSQNAAALGVNVSGQVTGFSAQCCGLGPAAFLYSSGQMQNLGNLGGLSGSQGNAINASGQITGTSWTTGNAAQHAFVYSNGAMTDLNSLISASDAAQYTLTDGVAINDNGQIVAIGYLNSNPANALTFLLIPNSPPVVTVSQTTFNFAGQPRTTTGATQTVTLTSSGTLSISSITASAGFTLTTNCPMQPATLAAGAPCTINVASSPTSAGPYTGSLTIVDNGLGGVQRIALSGTGTDFSLKLTQVAAGKNVLNYSLTATPLFGFAGNLVLTCGASPIQVTCSGLPSLTLNGVNAVSESFTVSAPKIHTKGSTPTTTTITVTGALPGTALSESATATLNVK